MHEFSLATQIVESVLDFAADRPSSDILKVRLQLGELTCVEAEQLRFCFYAITRETLLKRTELEIERVAAEVRCPHCRYEGPPKYWEGVRPKTTVPTLQCPECGHAADATRGHECEIKSVQFTTSKPAGASV